MGLTARVPCVACAQLGIDSPPQVHHMRDGRLGVRSDDRLVIALCAEHHVGAHSIHRNRDAFERQFGSELELHAATLAGIERVLMSMGVRA
jgi:hypothetical protein